MKSEIFIVKTTDISDADFHFMLKKLPSSRQEEILRQKIIQNRNNMLVGSILARYAIKKKFDIPVCKQLFSKNEFGKPYLSGFHDIYFSISHSGQYAACAVSDTPIGIDIQKLSRYNQRLAERICSKAELCQLAADNDKASLFTKLWTQKEAYVKMLGSGIARSDLTAIPTKAIKSTFFDGYWVSVAH